MRRNQRKGKVFAPQGKIDYTEMRGAKTGKGGSGAMRGGAHAGLDRHWWGAP